MFERVFKVIDSDLSDPFIRKYTVDSENIKLYSRNKSISKQKEEVKVDFQQNIKPIKVENVNRQQHQHKINQKKNKAEEKQIYEELKKKVYQIDELKKYNKNVNKKDYKSQREYVNSYEAKKKAKQIKEDSSEDDQIDDIYYQPYLDIKLIQQSRSNNQKKYYLGQASINERCKWFTRIISKEIDGKLVAERHNMNRAIHQSLVYFELVNPKKTQQSQLTSSQENEQNKIYCRVVAIKKHALQTKNIIGKVFNKRRKNQNHFIFDPIREKYPKFEIRKHPFNKSKERKTIQHKYYRASFKSWSQFQQYPFCDIQEQFGEIGEIDTQTKALLQIHNVYEADFTAQTQQFLKKFTNHLTASGQYIIPQQQYKLRQDLRNHIIYTIDPVTARDFDDALSITQLTKQKINQYGLQDKGEKIYEVGIHIADVSYFVPQGSPLDHDARLRTTSVYLVHRVIPMLPRILCQTMCSLNPGVQRLTMTVWCYITQSGIVYEFKRYGRSIIKSKARFSYGIAQDVITGKVKEGEIPVGFGVLNKEEEVKVFESLKLLHKIGMKLRSRRLQNGSLTLQNSKKKFQLDKRNWPISYQSQERQDANFLVQEFMLLANVKVAQILVKYVRQAAVLRRHRFPGEKKIKKFEEFIKTIGFQLQVKKQNNLSEQIKKIVQNPEVKSSLKKIIKYQLMFLLEAADYFMVDKSAEQTWYHYALNFQCYTHFTSPIRRYPDVLVHRLLVKAIEHQEKAINYVDKSEIQEIMKKSNQCKMAARKVSQGCQKIFMCLYLKNHEVVTQGIITYMNNNKINITIPDYDIRTSIELKNIKNIKEKTFDDKAKKKYISIKYESKNDSANFILKQTQQVKIMLGATKYFPIDYSIKLAITNSTTGKLFGLQ